MKRRMLSLLLSLCLLCPLFPGASAEEEVPSPVTALCVAEAGESVFLDEKEFQLLCRRATGHDLESVSLSSPSAVVGKLTCLEEQVTAGTAYYMYRRPAISQVCFTPYTHSSGSFSGQAEVAFTMTSEEEETVSGTLLLYVPGEPADTGERELSLMDRRATVKVGAPVDLCDHLPPTAEYKSDAITLCHEEITSAVVDLPSSSQGTLWLDYGCENARKLLPEETLFSGRAPNLYNLTFVPAGKEETQVQLTYSVRTEKKKALAASLTLDFTESGAPVLPAAPTETAPIPHFYDMTGWEWASPAAEFLGGKGYLSGSASFSPGENATRMDLIHALALTAYPQLRRSAPPVPDFSDLPDDPEHLLSVSTLAGRGVVLGNGAGQLLPGGPVSRQDAAVMIYRAMADRSKLLPSYGDLSAFSDAGDVAPYAQEAVTLLAARGVVLGDGSGKLDPLSPITRAEMACLVYRAFA